MKTKIVNDWRYKGVDYNYDINHGCVDETSTLSNVCITDIHHDEIAAMVVYQIEAQSEAQAKSDNAKAVSAAKATAKALKTAYVVPAKQSGAKLSQEDCFGICQIVASLKLSPKDFSVITYSGYYGEEVGKVVMEDTVFQNMIKRIDQYMTEKDLLKRTELLIKWEYGYLPGEYSQAKVKSLEPKSIKVDLNYQRLDREEVESFIQIFTNSSKALSIDHKKIPIGILLDEGSQFRIISGFCAFVAAKEAGLKTANFVVIS